MNARREKYILLKELGDIVPHLKACRAILAGGAITALFTNERVRDWDLYFRTQDDLAAALKIFKENGTIEFQTDTAYTFKWGQRRKPFQLIALLSLMGEPSQIFEHYDFTICMGAYDFGEGKFFLHDDFLKHLAQRRLVVHTGTMFPICSLIRVLKYQRRGFTIGGVEMMKLALAVRNVKIDTYRDLRAQLMGIDTAFLRDLTDRFAEGELAESSYNFEQFMEMIDEYMDKFSHLSTEDNAHDGHETE